MTLPDSRSLGYHERVGELLDVGVEQNLPSQNVGQIGESLMHALDVFDGVESLQTDERQNRRLGTRFVLKKKVEIILMAIANTESVYYYFLGVVC